MKLVARCLLTTLVFFLYPDLTSAMELNDALRLVQAWGTEAKDRTYVGRLQVDARGGFVTKSSGVFFRFNAERNALLVSGLVGYNIKLHSAHPRTWQKMITASRLEHQTLGEGELELYTQPLFDLKDDVILLTRRYEAVPESDKQFFREIRWLLMAAHYWFMRRYNDVLTEPLEEIQANAERRNKEYPKRPW
jgi:hypothetical protein